MTPIRFKRESAYAVSLFDDTDDGANRGWFSGPKEVIDGIMDMQEEARRFRALPRTAVEKAGEYAMHEVKGTGTDRGAAEAVAASVEQASDHDNISVPFEVWLEMGAVCGAAQKLADKLNGIVGLPALKDLTEALNTINARQAEDERDALDRVNDELAAEEAPTAGPENSVSIEELPFPELVMLLQSDQITHKRYIDEVNRRDTAKAEQIRADAEKHREHARRFAIWFF